MMASQLQWVWFAGGTLSENSDVITDHATGLKSFVQRTNPCFF